MELHKSDYQVFGKSITENKSNLMETQSEM